MDDHGSEQEHDRPTDPGAPTEGRGARPAASPSRLEDGFDWCFRDRSTGEITIAQFPNLALWTFLVSVVARLVVPAGTTAHTVLAWIGALALGWWAVDEVVRGVNPWRRALGVGGSFLAVSAAVSLLG